MLARNASHQHDNHVDVAQLLLEKGTDVNAMDTDGVTALHLAAKYGYVEFAQLLLENGANLAVNNFSCHLIG